MSPEREIIVGDQKISEYYWAGSYPVYVDNQLTKQTYDEAVADAHKRFNEGFAKLVGE